MTTFYNLDQIKRCPKSINLISSIEQGFIASSYNKAVIPPVGEPVLKKLHKSLLDAIGDCTEKQKQN